jgi:hypothetical protein
MACYTAYRKVCGEAAEVQAEPTMPAEGSILAEFGAGPGDLLIETDDGLVGANVNENGPAPVRATPGANQGATTDGNLPTGFTNWARAYLAGSGSLADLENRLRPWLPYRLRDAGLTPELDQDLADKFLAHLRTRLAEVKQRRFRELLPGWLAEFAQQQGLADRLKREQVVPTPARLEAEAVELVLVKVGPQEADWARRFRESALRSRLPTARALLAFTTAETVDTPALPNYQRDLFLEARRTYGEGLELFECEIAA